MTLPAGAQLGSTQDPKQLVKGEPAHIQANIDTCADEAGRLEGIYEQFRGVTIPSWEGERGQPAYERAHRSERDKWLAYHDLLEQVRSSLTTYKSELVHAQGKAQEAIDKWNQGEAATREAEATYNQQVQAYNAAVSRPQSSPVGNTGPTVIPPRPGPFVDPGEGLRQEAAQILTEARQALENAGAQATKELGGLPGARTEGSTGPSASGSVQGPSFKWGSWQNVFGKDPGAGQGGRFDNGDAASRFQIQLGEVKGQASVWGAQGSWKDYWGDVKVGADGSVTVMGVEGKATAGVSEDGLLLDARGQAQLAGAEGKATGQWGYVDAAAQGEAFVGAEALGHAEVGITGVHASGEVFAGAKVEGKVSGDVGGVGGEVGAEGWAGIGAAASVDAGYDDGKITVGGSGGLAFGLGGKLEGSITIDVGEVTDTAGDVADTVGGWFP